MSESTVTSYTGRLAPSAPGADGRPPVVDVLRDAIRQRLLPPGMPLVQSSIAEALGLSRIPVREALQYLASEGLVTFADDGARVTSLSPEEVHELWTLRALVESAMGDAIARNVRTADLSRFRELVQAMEEARDGDEWSEINYVFHAELYRASGLPHFASVATRILTRIEPYSRVAVNRLAGRGAAQAEHRELLAALEERDGPRLHEVLERHSTRARDLLVDYAEAHATGAPRSTPASAAARAFAARLLDSGGGAGSRPKAE